MLKQSYRYLLNLISKKLLCMPLGFFAFHFIFCFTPAWAHIYKEETPLMQYVQSVQITEPESGMPIIDCIYVINLDKRPEKWQRMNEILREKELYPNRIKAVDGWLLSEEAITDIIGPYPERRPRGNIGCMLSHLSAIKHAYEQKYKRIWIMEDDIDIVEDIQQLPQIINTLSSLMPDWDVLYTDPNSKDHDGHPLLSLSSDFRPDRDDNFPLSYYLKRKHLTRDLTLIKQRFGMYSLIVSENGIKKIYDYFSHVYFWTAIDIDIHYIPNIKQYVISRDLVTIWTESKVSDTADNTD